MLARDYIQPEEPIGEAVLRFLEAEVLTEAGTDAAIQWLVDRSRGLKLWGIPIPMRVVGVVLDALLPEKLLAMIRERLIVTGYITERRTSPANPFR